MRLNSKQRVALRGLFGKLGVRTRSGEEGSGLRGFGCVQTLRAGGGEAPLPALPDTLVEDLWHLAGNEAGGESWKAKGD